MKILPPLSLLFGLGLAVIAAAWLAVAFLPASSTQAAILRADPERILPDPALRGFSIAKGKRVFEAHCATCHGASAKGDRALGAPDLTDAEHLYGTGLVSEIEEIARHGIRSSDPRGWRLSSMPAYGTARPHPTEPLPPLSPRQIADITEFLIGLQGRRIDDVAAQSGSKLYQSFAGCWDCHGRDAAGDPAIGAPSLTDAVWLYGQGSRDDVYRSIAEGRAGSSPAYQRHLTAAELRNVAVYIASLQPQPTDIK